MVWEYAVLHPVSALPSLLRTSHVNNDLFPEHPPILPIININSLFSRREVPCEQENILSKGLIALVSKSAYGKLQI